jgi:hypothetical protein
MTKGPYPARPTSLVPVGYALGGLSVLAFAALLHHPVGHGHSTVELLASIKAQALMDQIVHGTLALCYSLVGTAMVLFAQRLGIWRFSVVFGLTAFFSALVLTIFASMTDGFLLPAIAGHCGSRPTTDCSAEASALLSLSGLQIEFMTRFSIVGVAVATAAWSVALLTTKDVAKWTSAVGLVIAGCQIVGLMNAFPRLTAANLLPIFAVQLAWFVLVAGLMIQRRGPFAE